MTRMTGPDCAVMCILINTHTRTHTRTIQMTRYISIRDVVVNNNASRTKRNDTTVAGRPGSSEVPRNPLALWDVSSIPANGIFLTKKNKNKNKNAQRVENN